MLNWSPNSPAQWVHQVHQQTCLLNSPELFSWQLITSLETYGNIWAFHQLGKWGYPKNAGWFIENGKSQSKMDDDLGATPRLWKPPYGKSALKIHEHQIYQDVPAKFGTVGSCFNRFSIQKTRAFFRTKSRRPMTEGRDDLDVRRNRHGANGAASQMNISRPGA